MSRQIGTPEQFRDIYLKAQPEEARFTFSEQQFAAIRAPLEPAVVLAGAGSGKTEVMAARVVYLVATGQVAPGKVLGLTFTRKAARELSHRIRTGLRGADLLPDRASSGAPVAEGDEAGEPVVSTYHSYAASLLTTHGLRLGHEPDTRVVTDGMRFQLATRAVRRHGQDIQHLGDHLPDLVGSLLALDAELSEHLVEPDQVRAYDAEQRALFDAEKKTDLVAKAVQSIDRRRELLGLVEEYRALKARLGLMDFSDQISRAARLAEEFPEVGAAERSAYAVVMLDEYQDTSVSQALLLSRLFSGPTVEEGFGHPVTAVGDPNQAIYGWRGASVSNILEFGRFFPRVDGRDQLYHLTVNRRSDRRILAVANDLAGDLYAARPEVLPLDPQDSAGEGRVEVSVHETYADELSWLSQRVMAVHDELSATREQAWRQIGVLVRTNEHAADVFEELTSHDIPVEIVGLSGLLRLPEVAEVVATLTLIQDVTANPALLTLLTGPRWAIGVRDLALLGQRAEELGATPRNQQYATVREHLAASVVGAEPLEIPSLCDALEDPGHLDYSPEARERFGLLADELRRLRAAASEPVLDLVRRIIDTTGIDVELASSLSPAAPARRDNLDHFLQAVTEFQAVDGTVSLPALLAWLQVEEENGKGLEAATPSPEDSVKVLTVFGAKGLEWDAVFLVGVEKDQFPKKDLRPTWLTNAAVLPAALRGDAADLEQLAGHTADDIVELKARAAQRQALEELRVAYVAWTRARHLLSVSAWCWKKGRKTPLGPSPYLTATRDVIATWGEEPERWQDPPDKKETVHPNADDPMDVPWPASHPRAEEEVARRRDAAARVAAADPDAEDDLTGLSAEDRELVDRWDADLERLLDEATRERATEVEVPLPSSLSATWLARLRDDPEGLARDLARPMPRPPAPAARFGTRFHAWVEARFGQQQLLDPDDLPGRADTGIEDDAELQDLIERFEGGPFADRVPHSVEPAFTLLLAGQSVRGRIDAVYAEQVDGEPGFLIVDWKTNQQATADPLQLAIYRVAWAELRGIPVERVRAQFYYVRTGEIVEPAGLPERPELEAIFTGLADAAAAPAD